MVRFEAEILLMSSLKHPNVAYLVGCTWSQHLMSLVMEYCEKGSSSDLLTAEGEHFDWADPLLKWSTDVALAFEYGRKRRDASEGTRAKRREISDASEGSARVVRLREQGRKRSECIYRSAIGSRMSISSEWCFYRASRGSRVRISSEWCCYRAPIGWRVHIWSDWCF
jgi:hypothetical protein